MKAESISPVQGLQTLVYYQQVFVWQFYLQRSSYVWSSNFHL